MRERHWGKDVEAVRERCFDERCFVGAGTPAKRIRPFGAGTPIRSPDKVSGFRRIGKRAHCAWRINGFQDWERLKTLSLRGRGAQCYSPPYSDLEAEGKEGRPRTLKRARPTSFLGRNISRTRRRPGDFSAAAWSLGACHQASGRREPRTRNSTPLTRLAEARCPGSNAGESLPKRPRFEP